MVGDFNFKWISYNIPTPKSLLSNLDTHSAVWLLFVIITVVNLYWPFSRCQDLHRVVLYSFPKQQLRSLYTGESKFILLSCGMLVFLKYCTHGAASNTLYITYDYITRIWFLTCFLNCLSFPSAPLLISAIQDS